MNIYTPFFNDAGRLRSGWRLSIFIITFIIVSQTFFIIIQLLSVSLLGPERARAILESQFGWILQSIAAFCAAALAGWFCCRMLEGLPFRALGWGFHKGWIADWLKGSLLGALSLVLASAIVLLSGGFIFKVNSESAFTAILQTLLISGFIFVLAAAAEEVLFRGYPLQTMTRARLALVGILLTSLFFAYVHKDNPNNPPALMPFASVGLGFVNLPFINTALAGVWMAVAYLRTRSLWFPLGLHWSWNWTMGALLGLPVSGIEALTPAPLLRAADAGPEWLSGGAYGIEGGAACTVALLLSTLFVWRAPFLSATPEMLRLTDHENPRHGQPQPDIEEEKATV